MGEDKWTHREPGSATGSVVPPPVAPDEPPPSRTQLPRRQPKASGHQRSADADQLITPVRRGSGSPGPDLSVTRSPRRGLGSAGHAPSAPGGSAAPDGPAHPGASAGPGGLTGSGGTGS